MLPRKETYTVFYKILPEEELLTGSVTLEEPLYGVDPLRQLAKAVKEKYGETADLIASFGEKIEVGRVPIQAAESVR